MLQIELTRQQKEGLEFVEKIVREHVMSNGDVVRRYGMRYLWEDDEKMLIEENVRTIEVSVAIGSLQRSCISASEYMCSSRTMAQSGARCEYGKTMVVTRKLLWKGRRQSLRASHDPKSSLKEIAMIEKIEKNRVDCKLVYGGKYSDGYRFYKVDEYGNVRTCYCEVHRMLEEKWLDHWHRIQWTHIRRRTG